MFELSERKQRVMNFMDQIAPERDKWIRRNRYYYQELAAFLKYIIPEGSSILEIGCGTGSLLSCLAPKYGVGIDISSEIVEIAQQKYSHFTFYQMDAENIELDEKFDFIVITDTLGYLEDIQRAFKELWKVSHPETRIIITYHSFLWQSALALAERCAWKMPQIRLNWLSHDDISNLFVLEGFEIIKKGRRLLFPKFVPVLSPFLNRYIGNLPLFNYLCIVGYVVAKQSVVDLRENQKYSVSVVVPARNERGNIENVVRRIPHMGKHVEIIFVEGGSTDGTLREIKRVCRKYADTVDVRYVVQDGEGKGDAVRKGFGMANGDVLMILDADLTVLPEDLTKFYRAISTGKGEFINGSRLIYPTEKESMRSLNMLGNRFFAIMFSWILGQRLKDTLCGTKVLFKKDYKRIIENRKYFGEFDPFGDFDLIFGAAKLNLKIVEIPIRYKTREYGQTSISRFKHGWLLLKMMVFAMKKIKFL